MDFSFPISKVVAGQDPEWDGEGQPEREAGSPMSKEPDAGLHLGPEMQADALLTEPPRHPSV